MPGVNAAAEASPSPRVGIFRIYDGEIFSACAGLMDEVDFVGVVDGEVDHAPFLEAGGSHRTRFPEPIDAQYFEVPRGRVPFDKMIDLSGLARHDLNLPSAR